MTSKIFIIVFLITLTYGREYPCTHQSKAFYDFSTLSKCDRSGYSVTTPSDGTFVLNICNEVNGCGGTGVCQNGQYNAGRASSSAFSDSGNNVQLTYSGGDGCPNGVNRKTVITLVCTQNANPDPKITFVSESPECTYNFQLESKEACSKPVAPQKQLCHINVFLVPHTHDDVGWLQTVEGYYNSAVKHILDTTVAQLVANPKRKFIYVEQAYFNLWWYDTKTSDDQRNAVRNFVKNGQWEFVLGSWVMPDEACTTYGGIIDQMTLGHQFLLNTFNVIPTKGWQIDPFGASSVTPVLEKLAGFDAHLIDRISHKDTYENSQRLEFLWQGSPSLGKAGEIFTEIMNGGGSVGSGYCDWLGAFDFGKDPVNSGNVAKYGQQFVDMVNSRIVWYKTQNMLAEWGCDFAFQNAVPMFHSMDQVVNWLQENEESTGVYVKYATLSEYYTSVWADKPQLPDVYQGDFLPYLGGRWWTGYYTSRTELKGWVRVGEAAGRVAETIYSLARNLPVDSNRAFASVNLIRVANGYAQHHDGVTGTSNPNVVEMYKDYLIDGSNAALGTSANYISYLVKKQGALPNVMHGSNAVREITNNQTVAVILYNSLGWARNEVVKLDVNRNDLTVLDSTQKKITFQISPAVGGNITSKYHLFFAAKVAPLGYQTFFVTAPQSEQNIQPEIQPVQMNIPSPDAVVENSILSVTISGTTGRISAITNKKSGVTVNVDQNLMKYISKESGAYAFGPAGPATPLSSTTPSTSMLTGPVVTEITQIFPSAKQTIRLFSDAGNEDVENFVELVFDIGPLGSGLEIITLFSTNITTQGAITTDDNGFELLRRQYQSNEPLEGNYYPLIYAAYINDKSSQLTVVSERSHGVASLKDGALEVMIHRNPNMGDGFGPGLTDTTEVYPALRVLVDSPDGSSLPLHRQPYLTNFPLSTFTAVTSSASSWANTYSTEGSFLKNDLPLNVHLLSVAALNATSPSIIVRLTHLFAVGENSMYSQPASVDFGSLFQNPVKKLTETTLSANKVLGPSANVVKINPKEIRTFLVEF